VLFNELWRFCFKTENLPVRPGRNQINCLSSIGLREGRGEEDVG